jgi:uncharacterized protein
MDINHFKREAEKNSILNKAYLKKLRPVNQRKLDAVFHETHEAVFSKIDCLSCANCCKTTSPIFYQKDIAQAAKALRMKPGDFVEKYLQEDSAKDMVLKQTPCPFLGHDNYCSIYKDRPTACREYPHTNRKKVYQLLDLTYQNTLVCPAVLEIVEHIKSVIKV